ncbi:MAG: DUF3618 domain-containing protein [Actinomycetes bacterium]
MSDVMPPALDATTPVKAPAPSVEDLQAEIESARDDLVQSLNELKAQTKPGALVKRGQRNVLGFFTDEFGGVRPDRVAIVGAVVVGILALGALRRRRR